MAGSWIYCGNWFSIYSDSELDLWPEKQSQGSTLGKEVLNENLVRLIITHDIAWEMIFYL